MEFDLQSADARFPILRRLLEADGHRVGDGGIVIAAPGEQRGLPYYRDESYIIRNAALTAEAAVALLMKKSERPLLDMDVLLCGYGRVGSQLARRLRAMGCRVTVAVRTGKSRASAESDGFRVVDITNISGTYHAVINTVPVPLLHGDFGGALCLELASKPGGWIDGAEIISAPGLPGRYAPAQAAEIMRDAIYAQMEERLWEN